MHRVVQMNSICIDTTVSNTHKLAIRSQLETYTTIYESQVNDGTGEGSEATLAVMTDFNSATDANAFHDWLKTYIQDNADDFTQARTRIHDCYHAAGQSLPCAIGDVWNLNK